jgi:hypothetical protein
MGPARVHRVFRDARSNQRDAAELISIQPLDYEQWLAAWAGNEGEDPFARGAAAAATAEELARVVVRVRAGGDGADACAICLTAVRDGDEESRLPCGHGFHPRCVEKWLARSKCCPQCRRSLADGESAPDARRPARRDISEDEAPTPANIPWSATSDRESNETTERARQARFAAAFPVLHELRREFEVVLRRNIVEGAVPERGAARVREALRRLLADETPER